MGYVKLDIRQALADPRSVYRRPEHVVSDPRLDRRSRFQILRRWEEDERALDAAEDEAMTGGEPSMLQRVLKAIAYLYDAGQTEIESPAKQGGVGGRPAGKSDDR